MKQRSALVNLRKFFAIALLFCLTTAAFAQVGTLVVPQPFVNPDSITQPDNWFFNFRLKNFAPGTEPLIKQTFGTTTKFETGGDWDYNSYNSHAVGFQTNLPTIALIEYGTTTAYGQATAQSDSYFYNHLLYIKGLQENTTYHYRIKAQDYDGKVITSADKTFTTKSFTTEIKLTQSDFPLNITKAGTYVLTEDVTSNTLGINIKSSDVIIDLNGHTLIYDNGTPKLVGKTCYDYMYGEEASYGIRAGLWNFVHQKIYNGIIKQGANGGAGIIGHGFNPLYCSGAFDEVAGVTADYYGDNITGMMFQYGNTAVHHNIVNDRGSKVDDRDQLISAIRNGDGKYAWSEIAYNSIRRARQCGIRGSGIKHHNEIYSDSYVTNSFLIQPGTNGTHGGAQTYNNKLFGMGYMPIGIGWASETTTKDNFIYMIGTAPTKRSAEYTTISEIAGIRFTIYGGNIAPWHNMLYENNTIILKPWKGCSIARGIWGANGENCENIVWRNNTVKLEAMTDELTFSNVDSDYGCVMVAGSQPNLAGIPFNPMIFEDNTFISNVNFIEFGGTYGISGSNRFYRTKFERITHNDSHFKPLRLGYWWWNTFDNRVIDSQVGPGVDLNDVHYWGDRGFMEVTLGNSKLIQLQDNCGNAIPDADVIMTLAPDTVPIFTKGETTIDVSGNRHNTLIKGARTIESVTGAQGNVAFDLLTTQHIKAGTGSGGTIGTPTRMDYTGYTINVAGYQPLTIAIADLKAATTLKLTPLNVCTPGTTPASNFKAYPNPTTGPLTVEYTALNTTDSIKVYTPLNELVGAYAVSGTGTTIIDLTDEFEGMYFLHAGTIVKQIERKNKLVADEWFFDFRKKNFAPDTEPLIKATFGNETKFEADSGYWEYPSFNSCAVGFQTNLPTIAQIEYGTTTAYGQVSEAASSYYYNHTLYIKNLIENATYHYRIKATDYDGVVIYSSDHSFTTKTFDKEIKLTQADIPLNITKAGTYVLMEDVVSNTLGINIKAKDVIVDLNGHTLIYDNGTPELEGTGWDDYAYGERASCGIRSGLWNFTNQKVFNGTIIQGANGGEGIIGIGYNPILYGNAMNEVAGLTLDWYGASVTGMQMSYATAYVHHNVLVDRGTAIDNRHQGIKAITLGASAKNEVAYNSIRRFRQQGIMGGGDKHHNEVYSDSYDTNSFLIQPGLGCKVENNKLFGTGYMPIGISWADSIYVHNNFIYMIGTAPTKRSSEYSTISEIAGIRHTIYGDNSTIWENTLYEDNTIILKPRKGCTIARGFWASTGADLIAMTFRHNTIKVEAMTEDLPWSSINLDLSCITLCGDNAAMPLATPRTHKLFEDNTLIGNVNLIEFGSSYGNGGNSWFYNTKMQRIPHTDSHFKPVRLGWWDYNSFNNRFIDTEFGEGVTMNVSDVNFMGSNGFLEFTLGNTHDLQLLDECEHPVQNAQITISLAPDTIPNFEKGSSTFQYNDGANHPINVLETGARIVTDSTDVDGKVDLEMLTSQLIKAGTGYKGKAGVPMKVDYSTYTINVEGFQPITVSTDSLQSISILRLTSLSGCITDSGGDEVKESKTIVGYPNPTNGIIVIDNSTLPEREPIHVSNFDGQKYNIYEVSNGATTTLDLSELPAGIYFLHSGGKSQKIVKVK
ncbi:MAG: T9SS type A sorting domain-containing protein [Candidatus Symbiothrix sp.]|jgi:hypothetical protein|nr:T9SS type A sorting domain-containing protein [Candidatus Symbiothrix sp.]